MTNYQPVEIQNSNNFYNGLNELPKAILVFVDDSTKIPFLVTTGHQSDHSSSTREFSNAHNKLGNWKLSTYEGKTNLSNVSSVLENQAQNSLNKLYSMQLSDIQALDYLFELVESAFANHDLRFVDALLANFDPNRAKLIVSTGLLRATSRAKSKLNSWKLCAARVIEFLNARGENTTHLLRGLIQADDPIKFSSTSLS
jgi:hypothetical protein